MIDVAFGTDRDLWILGCSFFYNNNLRLAPNCLLVFVVYEIGSEFETDFREGVNGEIMLS